MILFEPELAGRRFTIHDFPMMQNTNDKLYDPGFVKSLFDEMSKTYGTVNTLSSLGFCIHWRKQCADLVDFDNVEHVVDLMSGMSELSIAIEKRFSTKAHFTSIDLSPNMCALGRKNATRLGMDHIEIVNGDALAMDLEDESVDVVVSTFGLKTFSEEQLHQLARETHRILKPNGQIGFLEISVPGFWLLRCLYMFYIRWLIPIIGRLLMGNPDNYRLLGVYTNRFKNCTEVIQIFEDVGFELEPKSFFFGCASGFRGRKPI